ncbi:hypothetical protein B9Z19DRAFT_1136680 [Tuber borchii]|uniref:C2H2-type domain-containing protein n=1 Tax=Tuber borchii TaxID=42251 RepID=A0A2T6ZBL4_TUBBO|nr:hypothetical protein B9Z19DRAFT_1136680 [Tuber borchii]
MPSTHSLAGRSDPEALSGLDNDRMDIDEDAFQFPIKQESSGTGNGNKTMSREYSGFFTCDKCDVRFLGAGALHQHKLRGENEAGVRMHFYCGMCRIDFKDEPELKSHVMGSLQHVLCRKRNREFDSFEALALHSKQLHWPKPSTTHPCLGCDLLFSSNSAVTQHVQSGNCKGKLPVSDFRNLVSRENDPISKNHFQVEIRAGAPTTQALRAGVIPPLVKAPLAETPKRFKAEEPVSKGSISVPDQTLPSKPTNSRIENVSEFWDAALGVYFCPVLKCRKKFYSPTALQAHLESVTHDKNCPTCFSSFVSPSALLQHAQSEVCEVKKSPAYKELVKGAKNGLMDQNKKTEYKTCWRK